jgi:hypothetical protein
MNDIKTIEELRAYHEQLKATLEANCCYSVRVVSGVGQPGEFWRSTPHFCIAE